MAKRSKRASAASFVVQARKSPAYWTEAASLAFAEEVVAAMGTMSRADLARRIGVAPAFVTKVLRGNVNLTLETMNKLALALGMSVRVHIAPIDRVTRWLDARGIHDFVVEFADGEAAAEAASPTVGSSVNVGTVGADEWVLSVR